MELTKAIDKFVDFKSGHLKVSSVRDYRLWLDKFSRVTPKTMDLIAIEDFTSFKNLLAQRYSGKSIEHAFNILHSFFKFWNGEIRCINHERIRVPLARANSRLAITADEFNQLIGMLSESDFVELERLVILRLLWDTGMRVGELVSINMLNVDVDGMQATINTEKTYKRRTVYWSEETHRVFKKYWGIRMEIKRGDALFIGVYNSGEYSDRLTGRSIERMLRLLGKRAAFTRQIVPHSFRHSRIQRWLDAGLSLPEIILLSGHNSIVSLEHYLRLTNKQLETRARRSM